MPMKLLPFLLIASLGGCHFITGARGKLKQLLGNDPVEVTEDVSKEYVPKPPPTLEKDAVVHFTPKEKLLALFEQFNRDPDAAGQAQVLEEFRQNRNLFGLSRDGELVTVLNKTVPNIQAKNQLTLALLIQLLPLLDGPNKEYLRGLIALGLDNVAHWIAEMMVKFGEDKTCSFATLLPSDVGTEDKTTFLENRLNALLASRQLVAQQAALSHYLDLCVQLVQGALPPPPVSESSFPAYNP